MTKPIENESRQQLPPGPGSRLRAAREAKALEKARVAAQLHLKVDMITAIENDDFDNMPRGVFAKGYIRNYARFVGLDPQPLVDAYCSAVPEAECNKPLKSGFSVRQEVRSSHGAVKAVSWLLAIGLIVLLVTVWYSDVVTRDLELLQRNFSDGVAREQGDLPEDAGGATDLPFNEPMPGDGTGLMLPLEPDPGAQTEIIVELEQVSTGNTTAADLSLSEASTDAVNVAGTATDDTPSLDTQVAPFELVFVEDSWIRVKDSSGGFRRTGVFKKGERLVIGGEPPYQIRFGNSRGTQVMLDGKAYEGWRRHVDKNVASFSLDPRTASR